MDERCAQDGRIVRNDLPSEETPRHGGERERRIYVVSGMGGVRDNDGTPGSMIPMCRVRCDLQEVSLEDR